MLCSLLILRRLDSHGRHSNAQAERGLRLQRVGLRLEAFEGKKEAGWERGGGVGKRSRLRLSALPVYSAVKWAPGGRAGRSLDILGYGPERGAEDHSRPSCVQSAANSLFKDRSQSLLSMVSQQTHQRGQKQLEGA